MRHCNLRQFTHDTCPVPNLIKKYKRARVGMENSKSALEDLNSTANPDLIRKWERQARRAQKSRVHDVTSMDIYDAEVSKGEYIYNIAYNNSYIY